MKFIINLNGIILCPYQILLDIAAQIPNSPSKILNYAFAPICELHSTNDWINLESLGKPVAIRAKQVCDLVVSLLKDLKVESVTLAIYIDKGPLFSDNLFCILFLAQALKSVEVDFFTPSKNVTCLKASIETLNSLENIAVHYKTKTQADAVRLGLLKATRNQTIQELGLVIDDTFLSLDEIAVSHINQLIGYSWICLKSGAYDIACQLLEKTKVHPGISVSTQEQLFLHLLLIRFFSHQYALITESEFPEHFVTLEHFEVKTLQFLMAYSATLSQNLQIASDFFAKCFIDENMHLSDENSLYQLNFYAHFKMVQGEIDKALELELRIEKFTEEHQITTVGLKYVNFINIARLYKRTSQYDLAFEYYNKAYNEISGGGYTTSDHIYYTINLGSLCEAAGHNEQALLYWVKTALHWLACKNKYELSRHPRLILCQESISDITKPLPVDKANVFLLDKINELIKLCGIELVDKSLPLYQFLDDTFNIRREQCFIYKNILIYTCQAAIGRVPVQKLSTTEHKLSILLSQYIHTFMDIPEDQNVFIVDTHLDTMFLGDAEQAMAFANLSNCSSCYFNGRWIKLDNFEALKPMTASLSKVIESISQTEKGLSVHYKRSFLNKIILEQGEIDLVNLLKQTDFLSLDRITNSVWNNVHQLAKKRILSFSYPD